MITDVGLNDMAQLLKGASVTVPSDMAFGSTVFTPAAGDTSPQGEFDRVTNSSSAVNANVTTFVGLRTGATASNESINGVFLMNSSSGGDLYAEATVPSLLHTTAFDVEVSWDIQFVRRT